MKIHEGKCTEKILKERERIGNRLAILRKKRNMTQEELANLCGVNRVNIAKIEKGAYNVSIDILSKVTSALGFVIDIKVDSSVCPTHFSQRKPVKLVIGEDYPGVQFLFQFLNHGTEGGLCHAAIFGCFGKVAELVDGKDVFQLL